MNAVAEWPHSADDHLAIQSRIQILTTGRVVVEVRSFVVERSPAQHRLMTCFGDRTSDFIRSSTSGRRVVRAIEQDGEQVRRELCDSLRVALSPTNA